VQDLAGSKVLDGDLNQDWIVVAVGERAGASEEVEVLVEPSDVAKRAGQRRQ
jgi:hypothetical protein